MKKYILIMFLALMVTPLGAVGVADIPTIQEIVGTINEDVATLNKFIGRLFELSNANFQISVIGSTQTVSLTNAQKQGLIAEYGDLKATLQADLNRLP